MKNFLSLLLLVLFPVLTSALTEMTVSKYWCLCSNPESTACNYQICDDGTTGPICEVNISTNPTVQPGGVVTMSADAAWINTPTYGASCTAQPSGCAGCSNINSTITGGGFSGTTSHGLTNIGIITATIPSNFAPGNYGYGFSAGTTVPGAIPSTGNPRYVSPAFSYGTLPIEVTAIPKQCSDGIDNDSDGVTDAGDPQCNNNCVANSQHAPNHNSESVPPNGPGSCPVPTSLNLNGRAAFLQVINNFFASITSKAFAGGRDGF